MNDERMVWLDIQYYRENPDKFVEDYYGVKLLSYQRLFLKAIYNRLLLTPVTQYRNQQLYFKNLNMMAKILCNRNSIS